MKSKTIVVLAVGGCLASCSSLSRADEMPLNLKMSGYVEAGVGAEQLTGVYQDRRLGYVRGEYQPAAGQRVTAEINDISEFGSRGTLFVAGYEQQIAENWIAQAGASSSAGGVTLPRLRLDLGLGRKWLEQRNLVTTLGATSVASKDGHRDLAFQFSSAYFFDVNGAPWAVEGGLRHNESNPGAVGAMSYFAALTYGRDKERIVSLRLASGRESYQQVDTSSALVDFPSNSLMLTWRQWVGRNNGFQLRFNAYRNPYYDRKGIEAGYFSEF